MNRIAAFLCHRSALAEKIAADARTMAWQRDRINQLQHELRLERGLTRLLHDVRKGKPS